ncbi:MAG: zinc-dependent metalloprotease [Aureliella sp.]
MSMTSRLAAGLLSLVCCCQTALAQDYPPFDRVIEGFTKVEPPRDENRSMYDVYVRQKDSQVLLELPKNYADKKYFIGLTVASGQIFAGLQAGDFYVQWRQYNNRLALVQPNLNIRSAGDPESKDSVNRLFTGTVLLDLPIVTMSPRGGPVIDGDSLLVGNASIFFGSTGRSQNPALAKLVKSKAFPQNVELAFEMPNSRGQLQTLYYSISEIPTNTGYTPRLADQRIGYFTTSYSDYGKYKDDEVEVHYVNRWHLQKRDPSLKISPPVEPIKFYIEHTTPVRYRRWVKQGIEFWNEAFEKIGISDAIEVAYQDKTTGEHMDKDPEDVRYNFIRWLNNNQGTAIGPSRVHPETGQILDADIVLTDGWIRYFDKEFADYMPLVAMEGMSPETIAWLARHPSWDPRVRFANPSQRSYVAATIRSRMSEPFAGELNARWRTPLLGDDPLDGLVGRTSQVNGMCMAAEGRQLDMATMRLYMAMSPEALLADDDGKKDDAKKEDDDKKEAKDGDKEGVKKDDDKKDADKKDAEKKDDDKEEKKDDAKKEEAKKEEAKKAEPKKKSDESLLDGMPESFVGPLLADLVAHEVGHTLGLRHNFKASSIYELKEINGSEVAGKKPFAGSVMDYLPLNLRFKEGEVQGDYGMLKLGPYDFWAIEYGYTFGDPKQILKRVSEPELQYATDEDTMGPDPLARRYDFAKDPLVYAKEQMELIERFRKRLLKDYVKDGDAWKKARQGYDLTLSLQMKNISMMANWIGGAFIHRDKKGDPDARPPIEVVSAQKQRDALKFVLESTFRDEAYALTPELLSRLTKDFMEQGFSSMSGDPTWPVHDRILSTQAATLTSLLNATTLRRVYDNESRVEADEDAFTLPELLDGVRDEIWSELELKAEKQYTTRQPMISSLRRNLQREHMERMIDLTLPNNGSSAAYKAISNLAVRQLRDLKERIEQALKNNAKSMDPYTEAHLSEAAHRIDKALDADYVYNQSSGLAGDFLFLFHGQEGNEAGGAQPAPRPAETPYPTETTYPAPAPAPQPAVAPQPAEMPRPAIAPAQSYGAPSYQVPGQPYPAPAQQYQLPEQR